MIMGKHVSTAVHRDMINKNNDILPTRKIPQNKSQLKRQGRDKDRDKWKYRAPFKHVDVRVQALDVFTGHGVSKGLEGITPSIGVGHVKDYSRKGKASTWDWAHGGKSIRGPSTSYTRFERPQSVTSAMQPLQRGKKAVSQDSRPWTASLTAQGHMADRRQSGRDARRGLWRMSGVGMTGKTGGATAYSSVQPHRHKKLTSRPLSASASSGMLLPAAKTKHTKHRLANSFSSSSFAKHPSRVEESIGRHVLRSRQSYSATSLHSEADVQSDARGARVDMYAEVSKEDTRARRKWLSQFIRAHDKVDPLKNAMEMNERHSKAQQRLQKGSKSESGLLKEGMIYGEVTRNQKELQIPWLKRAMSKPELFVRDQTMPMHKKRTLQRKEWLEKHDQDEFEIVGQFLPTNEQGVLDYTWRPDWLLDRKDFAALCNNTNDDVIVELAARKKPELRTELDVVKLTEWLGGLEFFKQFPEKMLGNLHTVMRLEKHPPGRTVYTQGKIAHRMFIVLKGAVKLSIGDPAALTNGFLDPLTPLTVSGSAKMMNFGITSPLASARSTLQPQSGRGGRRSASTSPLPHKPGDPSNTINSARTSVSFPGSLVPQDSARRPSAFSPTNSGRRRSSAFSPIPGNSGRAVAGDEDQVQEMTEIYGQSRVRTKTPRRLSRAPSFNSRRSSVNASGVGHTPRQFLEAPVTYPVNALAIPSGTPRFQQATILGPGSCFGMQTDVDKSGQLREEMLLMTRGRRLWKKLQMSKRLGSIGNFAKNASRCARRETITVPDDASNPDNADGCTLIKISFADITRLLSDYHSSQAHRVAADIARVPFFENWSKALLYKLSLVLENKNFAKEETIYEQSDDADSIMFLVDGKVDLYKDVKIVSFHRWPVSRAQWQITKTEQIRSFRVKSISDPSYFGEEALFNAQTRDFSACALTAVRVYRCPRSAFMRIYQEFSLRHFRNKVTSARFRAIRHIQTQYLQEVGKDIQNGRLKRGAHVLRCNMTLKELAPNNDIYDTVLNDLPVVHVPGVLPYTALGAPTSVTNGISETHAVLVGDDGVMYEEPQDAIVQHVGVPGTSTYMRRTLTVHNTNLAGRGSGSVIEMHYHPLMGNILGYRR